MAKKQDKLKESTPDELKKKLGVLEEDLRTLRFKAQGAKSKNVKEGKALRREIAQVLTELNKNNKNK